MLPILREILGDPAYGHAPATLPDELRPRIRLDHDNIHHRPPYTEGEVPKLGNLHGGPSSWHVTAVYELKSVGEGEGGFVSATLSRAQPVSSLTRSARDRQGAVPGSHTLAGREALETMPGLDKRAWRKEWTDSQWTRKHPEWDASVPVHRVEGQAGDCILFT